MCLFFASMNLKLQQRNENRKETTLFSCFGDKSDFSLENEIKVQWMKEGMGKLRHGKEFSKSSVLLRKILLFDY